jgi:MFS superfamily sulfate permease-like transporter
MLPVERSRVPAEVLAGLTLAALGIPAVLGYAKIAGMPLVTGLYTMLLPMAAFVVLGSSRHLVVAADSATAVILAAALTGLAAAGSERYVRLAGLAALLTGAMLLAARLARLAFLANFLSRTVLVGFLTGVGIQVAAGELPDMLGVTAAGSQTLPKLADTVRVLPHVHWADVAVSIAVIVVVVVARLITRRTNRRIPGLLIAVIIAIVVSWAADLASHGVAVVGPVPRGLPSLGLPALGWHDAAALLGAAVAMFVVILAQSAATSRAYAAKYEEPFSEATDLTGLAAANAAAAFSGTFVVNGSPTKTQIVDSAGGRSQLSQLTAFAVVLIVLVLLTGPLAYLPDAALAAVVFLIAVELIDVKGMRHILATRKHEFAVALLTTAAVVGLGVEYGIVLAIIASIIDHLAACPGRAGRPHRGGTGGLPVRHQPVLRQRQQARGGRRGAGRPRRPAALDGHRLRRHRRRGLHRVRGPVQGRRARSPAPCAPGPQLRPRPGAAATRPLRHQQGPGSKCLLRHPRPGPRGLPLHHALAEALMPVASRPTRRARMVLVPSKVQMAPKAGHVPDHAVVQQRPAAPARGGPVLRRSARRHRGYLMYPA